MDPVRDHFLKSLSNYSECIRPYLRQIQEKYNAALFVSESEQPDLAAYCVRERTAAMQAKEAFESQQ